MTTNRKPKPPDHLSRAAKRWWLSIAETWELESHHLELLGQAAECLDRLTEARAAILRDGSVFYDRFGKPKTHPAMLIERDQKSLFARLCRELNLSEPADESRPPRLHGYIGRD